MEKNPGNPFAERRTSALIRRKPWVLHPVRWSARENLAIRTAASDDWDVDRFHIIAIAGSESAGG